MSGKKGQGLGNLNAVSHSWSVFWRRRALKASDQWILPVIESYAIGLASDKPGLTQGEARMIEVAQIARGASMLILAEAARSGFVRKIEDTWDLSPGAKELGKFLSVERGALLGLGLERRAKPALSLAEYLNGKPAMSEPPTTPTKGTKP